MESVAFETMRIDYDVDFLDCSTALHYPGLENAVPGQGEHPLRYLSEMMFSGSDELCMDTPLYKPTDPRKKGMLRKASLQGSGFLGLTCGTGSTIRKYQGRGETSPLTFLIRPHAEQLFK